MGDSLKESSSWLRFPTPYNQHVSPNNSKVPNSPLFSHSFAEGYHIPIINCPKAPL